MEIKHTIIIIAALALAVFSLPRAAARADVFEPDSPYREKYSLNGAWKFYDGDGAKFSSADFNDSQWKTAAVPGTIRKQNGSKTNVVWYRFSFTPPNNMVFDLLRFEQFLDEGEVWLNGEKLTNPMYQPPLDDSQPGVFQHVWSFKWPNSFTVTSSLNPGKKNVLAVRVTNDPAVMTQSVASFDSPTFSGMTGISGNVYLTGHSPVFIRSIERLAPDRVLSDGRAEHKFYVVVDNNTNDSVKCNISLTVKNESGVSLFEKEVSRDIAQGGEIVEFKWSAAPAFARYSAQAVLKGPAGRRDSAGLRFHGTLVSAGGALLFVNGKKFRVKGIEGMPGVEYTGHMQPTLKTTSLNDELHRLNLLGVNTIRTADPAPVVMESAFHNGIMVIPIIRQDWARTVIALREYPNLLYWDLEVKSLRDLMVLVETVSALDPYKRPISYTGNLEINPRDKGLNRIAIRGSESLGLNGEACADMNPAMRTGLPATLIHWGEIPQAPPRGYEALAAAPGLMESWKKCVENGRTIGAVYAGLFETTGNLPALRDISTTDWDPMMKEILGHFFSDFNVNIVTTSDSKRALELKAAVPYPLNNLRVFVSGDKTGRVVGKRDVLEKEQAYDIPISVPGVESDAFLIKYQTHGGIEHEFDINPNLPMYDPVSVAFRPPGKHLRKNKDEEIRIVMNGVDRLHKVNVEVKANNPGVRIKPASRGVYIPAYGDISAPFTVNAAAPGVFLLTATVQFTDSPGLPLKTYLPIVVE